jgi:hypothetical protein
MSTSPIRSASLSFRHNPCTGGFVIIDQIELPDVVLQSIPLASIFQKRLGAPSNPVSHSPNHLGLCGVSRKSTLMQHLIILLIGESACLMSPVPHP